MSLQDSVNGRDDDLRPSRAIAVLGTFNVRDGYVFAKVRTRLHQAAFTFRMMTFA